MKFPQHTLVTRGIFNNNFMIGCIMRLSIASWSNLFLIKIYRYIRVCIKLDLVYFLGEERNERINHFIRDWSHKKARKSGRYIGYKQLKEWIGYGEVVWERIGMSDGENNVCGMGKRNKSNNRNCIVNISKVKMWSKRKKEGKMKAWCSCAEWYGRLCSENKIN